MSKLTCTEIEGLLPALTLGALDDDERSLVMAHLNECPACRQKLVEYQSMAQGLLVAVPPRTPPAMLKQTLLAQVRPAWPVRLQRWLRSAQATPRWTFAAPYALVILLLGLFIFETIRLESQQAALSAQLTQQQMAISMLARDTVMVHMDGTPMASNASAVMRYMPQDTMAVVQTHALPPLGAEKAYQLWFIDSAGNHDSGAVFTVPSGSEGSMTLVIVAPRPLKDYVGCGVSIEPSGGSKTPTGPAALTGKLWS
jgi:anti-sigma factor RsiW